MKILHVIDNLNLGGTQHLAFRTWKELIANGHEVETCVLVNSVKEREWGQLPTKSFRLNCHGDYRRPFAIGKWSRQLSEVVDRTKPDVIHSWLWLSDIVSAGSAAQCRVPHVVHIVDRRSWQVSKRLRHRYRRLATRRAFEKARSSFLAVSQAAADFAVESLGIKAARVVVAYNSIFTKAFAEVPETDAWKAPGRQLRLGIAARIEPEKGHKYLIEAMRHLRSKGVACTLKITGDGGDRLLLERLVREYKLSGSVEFVGWVKDVSEFLAGIDVFLVPSIDSEGLPTTILEAMAAGRLVVATNVGGATEAIAHQHTGIIVSPKNANAIADSIESISKNRDSALAMVQNARALVHEKFSMDKMLQTIEGMYAKVSSGGGRQC